MDVKIIVAVHKEAAMPDDQIYLPVQVGKYGKKSLDFIGDDTGEHISDKNPYFCELTGLYWAWKNLNCEYIGLVHYRRYFSSKKWNNHIKNVLSRQEIIYYLSMYPIILPQKRHYFIQTAKEHYCSTHDPIPLLETEKIIHEKYPEMAVPYNKVMGRRSAFMWNMFIMEKKIADQYCEWLFDILFELEKRIDISSYNGFQSRVYGRISELLLNVWIEYKQYRYMQLPVMNTEGEHWVRKGLKYLNCLVTGQVYEK